MPIYDNNGTTDYAIGKVYDNNGTTDFQIGKVYDNNGTTDSLIYSAEEQLYNYGTQVVPLRKNAFDGRTATATFGTDCVELVARGKYGTNGAFAYFGTQDTIDFTPYTKMVALVRYDATDKTYDNGNGFVMGLMETWSSGVYNKAVVKTNLKTGSANVQTTIELDVSDFNGFYYPEICLSSYTSGDPTKKGYVYSWWLE